MFEVQPLHQDQDRLTLPCGSEAFNFMAATLEASPWTGYKVSCDKLM